MPAVTPSSAQVVIIGGGILGCSIAWHLTQLGVKDVLLLERNTIASAATSRAAALLTQARAKTSLIPLVRQTYQDILSLEEILGESLDLQAVGSLHVAASEASRADQQRLAAISEEHKITHRFLTTAEAIAQVPWLGLSEDCSVLQFPSDAFIDPYRLAAAYGEAARRGGARVAQGVGVTSLLRRGDTVCGVETSQGPVQAGTVIDAAGAWANLFGVALPMAPVRSHYWITGPDPLFPRHQPFVVMPDASAFARPELGGLLFGLREKHSVSADPQTLPSDLQGFAFAEDPDGWESLEEGADTLRRFFPDLDRVELRHYVMGLSTYTPDGLFVLGPLPGVEGFLAATGCCGGGIAGSGGIGRTVAQMAAGQSSSWNITPFRPERFGDINPFDPAFRQICGLARSGKTSG